MTKIFKKINFLLLGIVIISIFFRFYNFTALQYWSTDDEIFTAVVRKVSFENKPILLSPNATLGISLGSFFHLFTGIMYKILDYNPVNLMVIGSITGVLTTILMYFTGKELINKRVGLIAAFLYAASLLVSLYDRRWWPLSPNQFLITLAIYSLIKLINGRRRYFLPLIFSTMFTWHSDPSLAIIIVSALFIFWLYKIPFFKKEYLPGILLLIISFSTMAIFEVRHPGMITHPIAELFLRITGGLGQARGVFVPKLTPSDIIAYFSRSLFISPSKILEDYTCSCFKFPKPFLSPLSEILTVFFLIFPIFSKEGKKGLTILYSFIISFVVGMLAFGLVFKTITFQQYFTVVWPVFFLLAAYSLNIFYTKGFKYVLFLFLSFYLIANLWSLNSSAMRYPLTDKLAAVDLILNKINRGRFSLITVGRDPHIEGTGGVFYTRNSSPVNMSYFYPSDWTYRSFSLYFNSMSKDDVYPIIYMYPASYNWRKDVILLEDETAESFKVNNLGVSIIRKI